MPSALAPEVPASKLTELRVDERYQLVEGGTIPCSPGDEKLRDLGWLERGRGGG